MPAGWVSASCGSGVRTTDHRPELCRGGSWCYDITCAVQPVSYGRRLFHTACPADTRVPLLRRAHAEQPQPGPGAFYRNSLRGRQRGWRGRLVQTEKLLNELLFKAQINHNKRSGEIPSSARAVNQSDSSSPK